VLLPCVACNSLLGLDPTTERGIDAPLDAPVPPTCQPLPMFRSQPMQMTAGRSDYTSDPHELTRAVSWNTATMKIQDGTPGQDDFTDATFNDSAVLTNEAPRLAPSGDELFVRTIVPIQSAVEFRVFARGQNEWASPTVLLFNNISVSLDVDDVVSTPSAGAVQRRLVLAHGTSPHYFYELSEAGAGMWKSEGLPYNPTMFSFDDIEEPYLSPDALSLIFVGTQQSSRDVYILIRDSLRPFTVDDLHVLYQPTMSVHTPFVNSDCSRLYFSAGDGIYFVTP